MATKLRSTLGRRWALNTTQDIGRDGDIMIRRHRLIQTPLFGVYVHEIFRPDADRALHDHPWSFVTCILRGRYTEEHVDVTGEGLTSLRLWKAWSIHRMRAAADAHRIVYLDRGTVTLVLVGRRVRDWGFYDTWTDYHGGRHLLAWRSWREYLGLDNEPMVP